MDTRALSDSGFSADELELLTYLLEEEGVEVATQQTIFPRTQHDHVPLSFAQTRLWFLDQLEPGLTAYNVPFAMRLTGRLDLAALRRSLSEIVRRHEVLRTTFPTVAGQPVQAIGPACPLALALLDLRALPPALQEQQVARQATNAAQHAFDLAHGPLLIARLLRLAPAEHVLLLAIHHIVFDGWSIGLFLQEAIALYDAFVSGRPSPLPALPIQYADFAVWQRAWLQGEVLEKQLAYWRRQLGVGSHTEPPRLELPTDHPRPPRQTFRGAHVVRTLPAALAQTLTALSQREGATLFMTLLAAFNVLLARYSGQRDIVVGSPIANRDMVEIEQLIGFFVNTLLLRTDLAGNPSFLELLGRVRELTFAAYTHQNIPFEHLVDELQPQRDASRSPLFQVMFVLQNAPLPSYDRTDLQMRVMRIESGSAKFDLMLSMAETPTGLTAVLEYNTALFEAPTVRRLLGHFQTLLAAVAADPQQRIGALPLLTSAERQQLVEWNATARGFPALCPHEWFAAQTARSPDAVAVLHLADPTWPNNPAHLSYGALQRYTNQLAHTLRTHGVGPEVRVGLCLERSPAMIVGMLGILAAGGAYVPIDPAYPEERRAFMIEDSGVMVLITTNDERRTSNDEAPAFDVRRSSFVNLRADWSLIVQQPDTPPGEDVSSDNLAYVIYTSGSTGQPKGAMISQRSVSNFIATTTSMFAITPDDRILQFASVCFDVSVFEIFSALLSGATLCLTDRDTLLAPEALTALLRHARITIIDMAPAVMALLDGAAFPDLRVAFVGGEAFSGELVNRWARAGRRFVNGYGPTEATVTMTGYDCIGHYSHTPPIGRPLPNHQVYLLDQHLQPVPIGVTGELCIGGVGLARGYLARPDLTAEKFVPNPFADFGLTILDFGLGTEGDPIQNPNAQRAPEIQNGKRLYRTGDLARFLADGNIDFLGRRDQQLKIRGFRVEPGEIEAVLAQHPSVREVSVVAREALPGDLRLVAYLATSDELRATDNPDASLAEELYRWAQTRLPDHMIPSTLVRLDALPLTPSGKLDRRALPEPDWSQRSLAGSYVAPRTPVEQQVADTMGQLLRVERVGLHDNFFALGGHSLLATRLAVQLSEAFAVKLPLRSLFEAPTVAGLAERIETLQWMTLSEQGQADPVAEGHERGTI